MNKALQIIGFIAVLIISLRFLTFYTYSTDTDDGVHKANFLRDYNIYALPLPEDITFAGEFVPVIDPDIHERFDRELHVNTYWQSQTLLFIKRARRYEDIIEPILKKYGIPNDFKYLSLIESGYSNVVSPAGATGFWQILESTGKHYGLEITKEVDERYDVARSTEAAAKYLREAYDEFGNWTLAAASYNMGISGLKKQMERQKAKSYYDLTLNSETARYIFRILAVKEIMENQEKYGFHVREKDLYHPIPTYTLKLDTAVEEFGDFARKLGINYRILKYHNPWLRYEYLPNPSGKTYQIQIPKKGYYWLDDETAMLPEDFESDKDVPEAISDTTDVPDSE
ncbi:MAG: murein transglycosylase [Owenweeksia sp.]|nr:murein transglycosylase [Owenweeksia sp.]MBF99328.1 murein transglycosylase [Owenweeksia sp.]HBF20360.1 murein transglycosylase [Cryomorphaceae bacterium]|tara:strand:- start:1336 stop:2358 length:1023 start_codon:yes stop_codon:yes gene_type:complete